MRSKTTNYYDSVDQAILAVDFFESQDNSVEVDAVFLKAVDGLERVETVEIFDEAYIKITGEGAPAFLGPDMPSGMRVKELMFFAKGEVGVLCLEKALSYFDIVEKAGREGIDLAQVFEEVKMTESDAYLFTAIDGYEVEITGRHLQGEYCLSGIREKCLWRLTVFPRTHLLKDYCPLKEAVK